MKVTVSLIPDEGLSEEFDLPVELNESGKKEKAHVALDIFRTGKTVFIEGKINLQTALKCSRCLKEFLHTVDCDFRDEYSPSEEYPGEGQHELSDEELSQNFYRDDEIDTAELAREQILLSMPMKPLCNDKCAGICPECGKNLNKGTCQCRVEEIDPRLAPLKELRKKLGTERSRNAKSNVKTHKGQKR